MNSSSKTHIAFPDWFGEMRDVTSTGDFARLKSFRLEDHHQEGREYLKQFEVYDLLQGVEGDFVCGVPFEDSALVEPALWIRSVTEDFHTFSKGHSIDLRFKVEFLSTMYEYAFSPGANLAYNSKKTYELASKTCEDLRRKYDLLDEVYAYYRVTSDSVRQGSTKGRWYFPEFRIKALKGASNDADLIYDILEAFTAASIASREDFCYRWEQHDTRFPFEYRLTSVLGFGGKIYAHQGMIRVGCYPEDSGPFEREVIRRANAVLATLLD